MFHLHAHCSLSRYLFAHVCVSITYLTSIHLTKVNDVIKDFIHTFMALISLNFTSPFSSIPDLTNT